MSTLLLHPPRTLPITPALRSLGNAQIAQRRSFLSLSDLAKVAASAGRGEQEDVQTYHERKVLPYDRRQLYALVADIPSYPQFIPYCVGARILSGPTYRPLARTLPDGARDLGAGSGISSSKADEMEMECDAELEVGFMGVKEQYVSRVIGRPYELVQATATSQIPLFKSLVTTWSFSSSSPSHPNTPTPAPVADPLTGPTLLTIDLSYSFSNPLHAVLAKAFFDKVSGKMVQAFERRCGEVYGPGTV